MPGALGFGLVGMLVQGAYNRFRASPDDHETKTPFFQRLLDSPLIPLKRLSDEEYIGILTEKAISIDAEIAMVDEKIAAMQTRQVDCHDDQHHKGRDPEKG